MSVSKPPKTTWVTKPSTLPFTTMCYGPTKSGKTHWALHTFPGPVYVVETERRYYVPMEAAIGAGKDVRIAECSSFEDIDRAVHDVLDDSKGVTGCPGTVVFDSASDLLAWAEERFLRVTRQDKIYPKVVWARVYSMIDRLIEMLRLRGFYVVFLCREKEEYRDDKLTGRLTHEGYKRLPFKSDVVLRMTPKGLVVEASGLARKRPGEPIAPDMSADELFSTIAGV